MSNSDQCNTSVAQYTIGKRYTPELLEEVRAKANGAPVRVTGPRHASTMDLRPNRINLEVDTDDIIRRITCG
jgi:hypothetical protein